MPPSGFELDLARVRTDLVRAVARVCPAWMADRADDLVQVALIRVAEVYRRSEGKAELSSFYLRKAAYSALIDEIRRLRTRQEVPLEGERPEVDPAAPQPDPESNCAGAEIGQAIRDCLGRLLRPRRLAVTLHLQGHRVAEAARLLGWSAKKAENLVYRGLDDLRSCLTAKGIRP
ncbi:MAG TPA: RNA polymerase sigma factor [Thermoanaerobaculia bacterium]|nr:RNA polymerase sigma factor [Thermoanaerobaculia bacterium]